MKPARRSPSGLRAALRRAPRRWLLAVAAGTLAASLLRPTLPIARTVHDYVVILDITQSMNVTDYRLAERPLSRLEFARHALRQAIPALPCGTKVGWGIFTEYRSFLLYTPVEICANQREIIASLDRIDGRMAWSGNSEIAKGLDSALAIARGLPSRPAVVFISDGHEAPPLNPRHRPPFTGTAGEVRGLIVGTGGPTPAPIPKFDQDGRPLGFWKADEVMQTDPYSRGRAGSVAGEPFAETEAAPADAAIVAMQGAAGAEHLSALHEAYLERLATETGLAYHRLETADALTAALLDRRLGRAADGVLDLRPGLAAIALLALLIAHLPSRRRDFDAKMSTAASRPSAVLRPQTIDQDTDAG